MSRHLRSALVEKLAVELRRRQRAVDALDEAAALALRVNRTDLRCLDILLDRQQATPSQLAVELGLTTGSVTPILDRLEGMAYVRRTASESDRRSVIVTPTKKVAAAAMALYGPLVEEGSALMARFSEAQLETLVDHTRRDCELQQHHAERIRAQAGRRRGSTRAK